MNTTAKLLIGIFIGTTIVFMLLYFFKGCNQPKVVSIVKKDSIVYTTLHDTTWLKPDKIVKWKHDTVHDSIPAKYCEEQYSGTYKYVKGILTGRINYEVNSKDCGIELRFPYIDLPTVYHSEIRTVDTCSNPIKNHKWLWEINAYPLGYDVVGSQWRASLEATVSYWKLKLAVVPEMSIQKNPQFSATLKLGYKFLK